jgi:glycosyltransferase involved in cell wall biosynthesis
MLADWCMTQKVVKKSLYWPIATKPLLDNAAFVVLTAQGELDQSAKRHAKTPGVSIPLIFDIDAYREHPTPDLARKNLPLPPTDKPALLYLSRLDYKKRPDLLLAAGKVLRDAGHQFRLVFAGPSDPAYDAQLKAYAKSLKLDDITTFLGMVPAEWKPSLYNACDLFVLPTTMENFGFVYFEALVSATPVVTTKGTDTWRELEASSAGHIVDIIKSDVPLGQVGGGDVAALANTIAGLISNRPALRPMGEAGRRWVLENMDPLTTTRRYFEMYQRAIDGRRA